VLLFNADVELMGMHLLIDDVVLDVTAIVAVLEQRNFDYLDTLLIVCDDTLYPP